jgi:hypothetical protein
MKTEENRTLVTTTVGDVPEDELEVVEEKLDQGDSWLTTRECRYRGTVFPDEIGKVIRRDVWITFKRGQGAKSAQGL